MMVYKKISLLVLTAWITAVIVTGMAHASMEDNPLLGKFMLNRLELREATGDNPVVWDAQAWLGKDLNKLWIKSEGQYANSDTEEAELQLLYNRAVAPYWDAQVGWRADMQPSPQRDWLVLGMHGLAPYFFEVDTAAFIGENGRTGLRLNAEYELLFTQQIVLSPELEANLFGQNDRDTGTGSGLSDLEIGLRLRYEITREFVPYIGVNGWKKFGNSADFARAQGEHSDDIQWIIGVRAWY